MIKLVFEDCIEVEVNDLPMLDNVHDNVYIATEIGNYCFNIKTRYVEFYDLDTMLYYKDYSWVDFGSDYKPEHSENNVKHCVKMIIS